MERYVNLIMMVWQWDDVSDLISNDEGIKEPAFSFFENNSFSVEQLIRKIHQIFFLMDICENIFTFDGKNIQIFGDAGTGKSRLTSALSKCLTFEKEGVNVYFTASTTAASEVQESYNITSWNGNTPQTIFRFCNAKVQHLQNSEAVMNLDYDDRRFEFLENSSFASAFPSLEKPDKIKAMFLKDDFVDRIKVLKSIPPDVNDIGILSGVVGTHVLILDEVGMLNTPTVARVKQFLHYYDPRSVYDKPLGGTKVISVGDVSQLPCVITLREKRQFERTRQKSICSENELYQYLSYLGCIQSRKTALSDNSLYYMSYILRLKDIRLIELALNARENSLTPGDENLLRERRRPFSTDPCLYPNCLRVFSTHKEIRQYNDTYNNMKINDLFEKHEASSKFRLGFGKNIIKRQFMNTSCPQDAIETALDNYIKSEMKSVSDILIENETYIVATNRHRYDDYSWAKHKQLKITEIETEYDEIWASTEAFISSDSGKRKTEETVQFNKKTKYDSVGAMLAKASPIIKVRVEWVDSYSGKTVCKSYSGLTLTLYGNPFILKRSMSALSNYALSVEKVKHDIPMVTLHYFPFRPFLAQTTYAMQGRTIESELVYKVDKKINKGAFYTILTRARTLDNLYFDGCITRYDKLQSAATVEQNKLMRRCSAIPGLGENTRNILGPYRTFQSEKDYLEAKRKTCKQRPKTLDAYFCT